MNNADAKSHLRRIQLLFSDGFESPSFGSINSCTYSCPIPLNTEILANKNSIRRLEVRFAYEWYGFTKYKQCLRLDFYGESNFKKITNLPLDHEIIGVEGRISGTSITSLSLLIAGPSINTLSEQEKKA